MRLLCLLFAVCTALATVHASSSSTTNLQPETLNVAIKSYLSDVVKLNKLPNYASDHSAWFKCDVVAKTIHCTLNRMSSLADYETIVTTATSRGGRLPSNVVLTWAGFVKDGFAYTYDAEKYKSIPKSSDNNPIVREQAKDAPQRIFLSYKVKAGAAIKVVTFGLGFD